VKAGADKNASFASQCFTASFLDFIAIHNLSRRGGVDF